MFTDKGNTYTNTPRVSSQEAFRITKEMDIDLYIGVPDSLLKDFISSIDKEHITAANEAHAIGIAFGAMLAGRNPCVYLQNSGVGNIINPLTSLCLPSDVCPLLVIGHRHTIEQHKIMGEVDGNLMNLIGYSNYVFVGDNEK